MSDSPLASQHHSEELDLVIRGMQGQPDEERVRLILMKLPGVQAARIIPEGAWIRYEAARITKDNICDAVRQAGFKATLFQDSFSKETHNVSQH